MSTAETASQPLLDDIESRPLPGWLGRLDEICETIGDRLNPILVKETRQALKSRQFMVTFGVLLVAALAWTVIGSLSMMPQIYTSPSAPKMLIGYYFVLAVPMLLVVPLAANRSLENEIGDGTLELLSITVLSPWQIVLGKLASAVMQMLLYFFVLFPCVAYAYTLRGVDLPTIGVMISTLAVSALLLTVFGIFTASASRSKSGRMGSFLVLLLLLVVAEIMLGAFVVGVLLDEILLDFNTFVFALVCVVTVVPSFSHLMLAAAAAQLTPESENRSTQIRVSILILTALSTAVAYLANAMLGNSGADFAFAIMLALSMLWTFAASMMCSESSVMTPRIQRELPSSFLARMALTWFTPGPLTGLVFSSVVIAVTTAVVALGFDSIESNRYHFILGYERSELKRLCIGYCTYLIGFLIVTYWLMRVVRLKNNPRVEIGVAAMATVALLAALIPYSIALQAHDFRAFPYGFSQITNWAWTIPIAAGGGGNRMSLIYVVGSAVGLLLLLTVSLNRHVVMARRTMTPQRVQEELERLHS